MSPSDTRICAECVASYWANRTELEPPPPTIITELDAAAVKRQLQVHLITHRYQLRSGSMVVAWGSFGKTRSIGQSPEGTFLQGEQPPLVAEIEACNFCSAHVGIGAHVFVAGHGGAICHECVDVAQRILTMHGAFPRRDIRFIDRRR